MKIQTITQTTLTMYRASAQLIALALTALLGLNGSLGQSVPGANTSPLDRTENSERGDVPGWVMITLMSAALVALLLAIAGPALEGLFNQAMDSVGKK
ncbi:hypothetical protein ACQQCD_01560 [Pseudarthrobacter sp. J1763]|uniref:hypothetical protein n=1 Tax=Pseudarthrobacter sp. J1763 TaxID=3420445 RepID=UPI003D290116